MCNLVSIKKSRSTSYKVHVNSNPVKRTEGKDESEQGEDKSKVGIHS